MGREGAIGEKENGEYSKLRDTYQMEGLSLSQDNSYLRYWLAGWV